MTELIKMDQLNPVDLFKGDNLNGLLATIKNQVRNISINY